MCFGLVHGVSTWKQDPGGFILVHQAHAKRLRRAPALCTFQLKRQTTELHPARPRASSETGAGLHPHDGSGALQGASICSRILVVLSLAHAALLIIDVQKAIDADYHAVEGPRNNRDAEQNIARLLAA